MVIAHQPSADMPQHQLGLGLTGNRRVASRDAVRRRGRGTPASIYDPLTVEFEALFLNLDERQRRLLMGARVAGTSPRLIRGTSPMTVSRTSRLGIPGQSEAVARAG